MPAEKHTRPLQAVYDTVESLAAALLLLAALFTFAGKPMRVDGKSMLPTLKDGQFMVITAGARELKRGMVVVVSDDGSELHLPIVKRVIGLPGDVIDIDFFTGVVSRNRVPLEETYVAEPTRRRGDVLFPVTVPEGACFVMGDNRNHSTDSRYSTVGMVDQREIAGLVVWPNTK